MKNILAENMLRFGVKNLSKSDIQRVKLLTEAPAASKIATITYNQKYNLKAGVSDPSSYINNMVTGIISAIQKDPLANDMLTKNSIKLVGILFIGGASNSWAGKTTGYDTEKDYKTKATPTETKLYQLNLDLAKKRADECKKALLPLLEKQNIQQATKAPANITSVVYNSDGKLNENYQIIRVILQVAYATESPEIPDNKPKIPLPEIAQYVYSGAYFTWNELDSTGTTKYTSNANGKADYNASIAAIANNKALIADKNRLIAFEIKWDMQKIQKDKHPILSKLTEYKYPVYRWVFIYNEKGEIDHLVGKQYSKNDVNPVTGFKNDDNIKPSDTTFETFIKGAKRYDLNVAPFLPKIGTGPTPTKPTPKTK